MISIRDMDFLANRTKLDLFVYKLHIYYLHVFTLRDMLIPCILIRDKKTFYVFHFADVFSTIT